LTITPRSRSIRDADFHYDFAKSKNTSFWLGGAPRYSSRIRRTALPIPISAWTSWPFAQLRGTVTDNSQISIAGGIRF